MLSPFNEDATDVAPLQNRRKKDGRRRLYDFNLCNWRYSSPANVMKVGGLA